MAAKALGKPAKGDATNLIAGFIGCIKRSRPVLAGYLRTPVLKYQGTCAANLWPPWPLLPWNIWDPDINYPALIPIIAHAYLQLTLGSMHALSSPPGINHLTHRTHPTRNNCVSAHTQEPTRN
jgi:hypothetical protein